MRVMWRALGLHQCMKLEVWTEGGVVVIAQFLGLWFCEVDVADSVGISELAVAHESDI
jgi:hypothetical protein